MSYIKQSTLPYSVGFVDEFLPLKVNGSVLSLRIPGVFGRLDYI